MARRTSNKIQPAVQTLFFTGLTVPASTFNPDGTPIVLQEAEYYIDLSQCASLANRRFYRQGLNWAVAGFKMVSGGDVRALTSISKIPNTWVASNAWEKAFRAWNKQQMNAIDEAGAESAVARFRDFKVFADADHATLGIPNNLLPFAHSPGEWEHSLIVLPNADIDPVSGARTEPRENMLHMVGANEVIVGSTASRGIIEGYADSRAYPQSPDPVSPAIDSGNNWMRAMFDVGNDNEEVTDNATDRNDNLPYPQVEYPGGQTQAALLQQHDREFISATTIGGTTRLKGGNFPCGLIKISLVNLTAEEISPQLYLDLIPGNHRGYLCEPMTEM